MKIMLCFFMKKKWQEVICIGIFHLSVNIVTPYLLGAYIMLANNVVCKDIKIVLTWMF